MKSNPKSYLGFRRLSPSKALRDYVSCYWAIQRDVSIGEAFIEYLYPDGCIGMVFDLGDPFRFGDVEQRKGGFLDGTTTRARRLMIGGEIHAVGVRFKPGCAFPFFPVPLSALKNEIATLCELGMSSAESLCDQMHHADTLREKVIYLERWLFEQLQRSQDRHGFLAVRAAVDALHAAKGNSSVQSLSDAAGLGRRQLERLFQRCVGMSPKALAQVLRVDAARNALRGASAEACVKVGYEAGFYDQAHFIREFTEIAGITPGAYRKLKRTVER